MILSVNCAEFLGSCFGRFAAATAALALLLGSGASVLAPQQSHAQPAAENARKHSPSSNAGRPRDGAAESGRASSNPAPNERPANRASDQRKTTRKLPADVVTDHALNLADRTLRFTATAGSIPLFDGDSGELQAEVAYTAYVVDAAAGERPVTFLFNGGPGAASAYLNIGALGPWRLPFDAITASGPSALRPNAQTWLDFTDLVFVDPPGTGYSRLAGGDNRSRRYWSVDGDAEALAVVIRKWINQAGRQRAAKFLVGESYGGMRVLKIARALEQRQGVGVRGFVLISPVLDFARLGQRRHRPMSYVTHLPSMAATALELKGGLDRKALAAAEAYASGAYLADLMRGVRDEAAVERISERLSALIGLDKALIKRFGGRIDSRTFRRELYRSRGLVGSAYDATITALDPTPSAPRSRYPDPVLDATRAPLISAMTELYRDMLKWQVDKPYRLLNGRVSSRWNWGRGRSAIQSVDELRTALASDRHTRILIAHGASDLVTPYFANKLILDQLPAYASERAKFAVYGGGHMFYSRDESRRELRRDAAALYAAALAPE